MSSEKRKTLNELINSSFLNCHLCEDRSEEPMLLSCLHTLCHKCVKLTDHGNTGVMPSCPVCCTELKIPPNEQSFFKQNYFTRNLNELADCHKVKSKVCDYCKYDDQMIEAGWRCLECQDNLCDGCSRAHRRTKLTRDHKVVSFDEVQKSEYDSAIRKSQHLYCDKHHGEMVNLFCNRCEICICRECKVREHDYHNWTSLDLAGEKYLKHSRTLNETVRSKISGIKEYLEFLKTYDAQLQEDHENVKTDIIRQAEQMHAMVNQYKDSLMMSLEENYASEVDVINSKCEKLHHVLKILHNTTDFMDSLLDHGNPDELLVNHRMTTDRLNELAHLKNDGLTTKLKLEFVSGSKTVNNIKAMFGTVVTDQKVMSKDDIPKFQRENKLPITSVLPELNETPELVLTFMSAESEDTKDIWPTGIDIDENGNMVILDRNNQVVKVFDENGQLIRIFGRLAGDDSLGCPYDLTILKNGSIAVSDYGDESVKIFSSDGTYIRSLHGIFKYPRGVAVNSQGQLLVADCENRRLTLHNPDSGQVIKVICGKDAEGNALFTDPYYVTTNPCDYIIVTDWAAPNLKIFNPKGECTALYGSYGMGKDQVLQPYGVCTDAYGYIFMADNQNHRIHLLAPDGTFVKFLLTKDHGLCYPMAVTINKKGQLVVTEGLGKVKVFSYL